MGNLYNYFFVVVFLIGVALVFLASEFGWRLGIRTEGHGASGNISALEQSLLGFLALIVGFTFLMALTRFEARREAVLNEANAIGTTALRARLLPQPPDAIRPSWSSSSRPLQTSNPPRFFRFHPSPLIKHLRIQGIGRLVCSVILVVLDLDRPNVGFITISQQPMIDTVANLSAFND